MLSAVASARTTYLLPGSAMAWGPEAHAVRKRATTRRREALKVEALMVIDRSSAFLRSLGLLGPPSQRLGDLVLQPFDTEGLGDEWPEGCRDARYIVRGHEHHLYVRTDFENPPSKLAAVHDGHHDICEK